ncbi:HEAT repeat domain-containing protein [Paenibacillus sp. J22TS3]|uniref:HEAT repeat domain-containing protein n=1 Tax=Paenibacillus sp. J22TS3 TaxID=2807192 RepID=UPI001B216CAE|nr:HEAT repeat domain-containing protein [Paenibacillus sp. J22TS3]GIP24336.1 hypothetical protein J22TS3_46110 [Paenibacillus sp. J22TS3]
MYEEQLNRIRRKLELAAEADPDYQVFGARSHRYKMKEPLQPAELRQFEQTHGVTLPEDYAAFLTGIGNGGAGPYYGIHPLGKKQSMELDGIAQPSHLHPKVGPSGAGGHSELHETNLDSLSDEEYDQYEARMFQGLLNIGEQGCTYETMLVVTGEHRGKVVYLDVDSYRSFFTYEQNFLDWYERWLDETIASYDSSWFGLRRGGNERELGSLYSSTADEHVRIEALQGMLKLPEITDETAAFLEEQCREESGEVSQWALQVLAKMRFDQADPLLRQNLNGQDNDARLLALQLIKWYMPQGDQRFAEEIVPLLPLETNIEAFRFMTYILDDAGVDLLQLMLPLFNHPLAGFRIQAIYQAGKSTNKADALPYFTKALEDPDIGVKRIAIQALSNVPEPALLEVYERLLRQHKTDDDYIRSNISRRLQEFDFASMDEVERAVPASLFQVRGMLRASLEPYRRK